MKIEFETIEELQSLIEYLGSLKSDETVTKKRAMTGAERVAKCRANKKTLQEAEENVTETLQDNREKREEEREEKEAVSPLVPPSLSPDTPYPIPPIIPPSQEKEEREGERKERDSAKSPKPVKKNHHGEYQHVLLTADEFFKLLDKFGEDGGRQWIKKLDEYLENNRKKHYDNHYLTILNWARRDEKDARDSRTFFEKGNQHMIQQKAIDYAEFGRMLDEQERNVIDL